MAAAPQCTQPRGGKHHERQYFRCARLAPRGNHHAARGPGACEPTSLDDSATTPSRTLSVRVENAPVVLRASREYRNPNTWTDGEVDFTTPLGITLPASLRVTQGNAGNHKAELWYRDGAGNTVNCDYRGGSDEPHPTSDYQRALGQRYVFERCSHGAQPGDAAHVTWLKLHVRGGDQKDATGRTEVEWRPGGTGDLEPPLSPAESVQTRDAFSWERTQPVAETNAEDHPALYSALIYLEDRDHVAALDELLLHHDSLPLFAAELEQWKGQRGFFQHEWDGKGLFRFALVPGAIYNRLREAALQGNVVFRAVVLRDLPASARGQDGSLSYAALRASGFLYRGEGPAPAASGGTKPRTVKQELFGAILRRVVKAIADVAVGVVNEVRARDRHRPGLRAGVLAERPGRSRLHGALPGLSRRGHRVRGDGGRRDPGDVRAGPVTGPLQLGAGLPPHPHARVWLLRALQHALQEGPRHLHECLQRRDALAHGCGPGRDQRGGLHQRGLRRLLRQPGGGGNQPSSSPIRASHTAASSTSSPDVERANTSTARPTPPRCSQAWAQFTSTTSSWAASARS